MFKNKNSFKLMGSCKEVRKWFVNVKDVPKYHRFLDKEIITGLIVKKPTLMVELSASGWESESGWDKLRLCE